MPSCSRESCRELRVHVPLGSFHPRVGDGRGLDRANLPRGMRGLVLELRGAFGSYDLELSGDAADGSPEPPSGPIPSDPPPRGAEDEEVEDDPKNRRLSGIMS